MNNQKTNRKFGRVRKQRVALMRGLALSLVIHERITTTAAKAKELRPYIEKLVTKAGSDTVFSRRFLNARLGGNQETLAKKLVEEIAPKYRERQGGYTRVVKLPPRQGDAAEMAIIEFV
ncbi:MAG: 50S ribosomal protein L17 [Candidatus Nomurabacteria bacterium]|nr:50S ribosomal protein L17 [Candidatus Nomurabacteria bacterium]